MNKKIDKLSELLDLLRNNNLVIINNYSKKDGTSRDIHSTLNFDIIPKEKHPKKKEISTMENMSSKGLIVIFDVKKNSWKSLTINKIKKCVVGKNIYTIDIKKV